ncbi:hypothetical protein QUF72_07980 [Desulfobacterales bacterium HSG2]|nr:hypothetical protein [Desulfobacterales bacterium HSG2]
MSKDSDPPYLSVPRKIEDAIFASDEEQFHLLIITRLRDLSFRAKMIKIGRIFIIFDPESTRPQKAL